MSASLSVREIKVLLQGLCPGLILELAPGARREGNVFSAPNPTRAKDAAGSFKIWRNGAWREYDEGAKGDVLGLVAYVHGHEPKSTAGRRFAIQWAKQRLGLADANPQQLDRAKRQAGERRKQADEEELARPRRVARRVQRIVNDSHVLTEGDAVWRYLAGRGIDLARIQHPAGFLRRHDDLLHWAMPQVDPRSSEAARRAAACGEVRSGAALQVWRGPAMIGVAMTLAGPCGAVHATWLGDGPKGKAPIDKAKLMLGPIKGGVVPISLGPRGLTLTAAVERGLADPVLLAEGVETAARLAMDVPECRVWACLSLGNIANAPVGHAAIAGVIVALENDVKPEALRQRDRVLETLEACGKPLSTMTPHMGSDFAEVG